MNTDCSIFLLTCSITAAEPCGLRTCRSSAQQTPKSTYMTWHGEASHTVFLADCVQDKNVACRKEWRLSSRCPDPAMHIDVGQSFIYPSIARIQAYGSWRRPTWLKCQLVIMMIATVAVQSFLKVIMKLCRTVLLPIVPRLFLWGIGSSLTRAQGMRPAILQCNLSYDYN
jgi:hypothetical protein